MTSRIRAGRRARSVGLGYSSSGKANLLALQNDLRDLLRGWAGLKRWVRERRRVDGAFVFPGFLVGDRRLVAGSRAGAAWTTVRSAEGDFSFSLPSPPREQTKEVPSPSGKLEQKIYFCRTGGSLFVAQQIRYPAPIPAQDTAARLAAEKKGYLPAQAELLAEQAIVVDGVSAEDFTYRAPSPRGGVLITTRIRHLFKGPFYYTLTVMSPPDQPLPAESGRFLNSMSLSGEPKQFLANSDGIPNPAGSGRSKAVAPEMLGDDTPEGALRTFMIALVSQDAATLRRSRFPHRPRVDPQRQGAPARSDEQDQAAVRQTADPAVEERGAGDAAPWAGVGRGRERGGRGPRRVVARGGTSPTRLGK